MPSIQRWRKEHGPSKIVVLLHERDTAFESQKYLMKLLTREWEGMGISVEVIRGTHQFVPADLLVPHIDLTITPAEYRAFLLRYPKVLNKRVMDISKSRISTNLVSRRDSYGGPVIVKTNRNAGGMPEHWLLPGSAERSLWRGLRRRIGAMLRATPARTLVWRWVDQLSPDRYPVFSSLREVPTPIFHNKNLIVERFLPEREGDNYRLRHYYFVGDKEVNIRFRSRDMIVKGEDAFEFEELPVPAELRSARERLGFDYGKFDYVIRDGKVVLFDVNRTPQYATLEVSGLVGGIVPRLAEGIWATLDS